MRALLLAFNMAVTTLTGVIYEKNETFVIAETETMKALATLEAVEFNNGHFANYVGQTVRVKGELITAKDGHKVLRIRSTADIEKATIPPR